MSGAGTPGPRAPAAASRARASWGCRAAVTSRRGAGPLPDLAGAGRRRWPTGALGSAARPWRGVEGRRWAGGGGEARGVGMSGLSGSSEQGSPERSAPQSPRVGFVLGLDVGSSVIRCHVYDRAARICGSSAQKVTGERALGPRGAPGSGAQGAS